MVRCPREGEHECVDTLREQRDWAMIAAGRAMIDAGCEATEPLISLNRNELYYVRYVDYGMQRDLMRGCECKEDYDALAYAIALSEFECPIVEWLKDKEATKWQQE